jgi:hypothetical protein
VFRLRFAVLFLGLFFLPHSVQAQLLTPADWSMLPDPEAQRFEDPYRDLRQSQFESLMALARLQITLSGATAEGERAVLHERASRLRNDVSVPRCQPIPASMASPSK